MPVISAILIPWDMVAEHGLASIFLYVSRDISILSAICACVNPAIWRACFTEYLIVSPPFCHHYSLLNVDCQELFVDFFHFHVAIFLLSVYTSVKSAEVKPMSIGENIKKLRESHGLTQSQLGDIAGVSDKAVSTWESGLREPRMGAVEKIAQHFGLSKSDLLFGNDDNFHRLSGGWGSSSYLVDALLENPPSSNVVAPLIDYYSKKAPSLSDEAMKIAKDYSDLDSWGKSAVREVLNIEKQRCEDEDRFINDTQFNNFEPKVINRYLEPSAAGIAAPVEGKDFEPYELGPDDPQGAAYAIRVQGDSMEPDFPDGSTVFVNHDAIVNGDIGVFCVDGGTVIKQYYRDPFGMTYLFSLNRKRADADVPIYPSSSQTLVCQGRVITRHRYPIPPLAR